MKERLEDLAIFGGAPAFAEKLHVGRPNIGDRKRLLARIEEMLDRRYLSNDGPFVRELEARIAEHLGVRHCVAITNGTIALEILIRALGLQGEVIVPAFTFVATAHALQWQGIEPVFCDIDPRTHCLDPRAVERAITPRTTGIIGVHLWGRACAVREIEAIAAPRDIQVLYDAAHAFGASYDGRMIGGFGRAEVLSFHATKFFNSFEGGAIVTNDDALADKCKLMRNFGFAGFDKVIYIGTNGKMTEACAAMGLTSLEALDEFIAVNKRNHERYTSELAGIPGLKVLPYDPSVRSNYQYVVLEIDEQAAGCHRDLAIRVLNAENVVARRYFYPGVHRMEPYLSARPGLSMPITEAVCQRVMSLPTGTAVSVATIDEICQVVRFTLAHGPAIASREGARS